MGYKHFKLCIMSKFPQKTAGTVEFEPPPRLIIEKTNSLFFAFALLVDTNKWLDPWAGREERNNSAYFNETTLLHICQKNEKLEIFS